MGETVKSSSTASNADDSPTAVSKLSPLNGCRGGASLASRAREAELDAYYRQLILGERHVGDNDDEDVINSDIPQFKSSEQASTSSQASASGQASSSGQLHNQSPETNASTPAPEATRDTTQNAGSDEEHNGRVNSPKSSTSVLTSKRLSAFFVQTLIKHTKRRQQLYLQSDNLAGEPSEQQTSHRTLPLSNPTSLPQNTDQASSGQSLLFAGSTTMLPQLETQYQPGPLPNHMRVLLQQPQDQTAFYSSLATQDSLAYGTNAASHYPAVKGTSGDEQYRRSYEQMRSDLRELFRTTHGTGALPDERVSVVEFDDLSKPPPGSLPAPFKRDRKAEEAEIEAWFYNDNRHSQASKTQVHQAWEHAKLECQQRRQSADWTSSVPSSRSSAFGAPGDHLQSSTSSANSVMSTDLGGSSSKAKGKSRERFGSPPGSMVKQQQDTERGAISKEAERNVVDVILPLMATLESYKKDPPTYFNQRWIEPPGWCVDRSPEGMNSAFGGDWGTPPARVGRDPRYRAFHSEQHSSPLASRSTKHRGSGNATVGYGEVNAQFRNMPNQSRQRSRAWYSEPGQQQSGRAFPEGTAGFAGPNRRGGVHGRHGGRGGFRGPANTQGISFTGAH